MRKEVWSGKKILVTGHTGFKGSWLVYWLSELGCRLFGLSLRTQPTIPSLYYDAKIGELLEKEYFGDIRDKQLVEKIFSECKPDYVFHLAAQAIVRKSFINPIETISTNVLGSSNILYQALSTKSVLGIIIATTDKVYKNNGIHQPFKETDSLGGSEPYSSSKAASELVITALNQTYNVRKIPVTTVRAGNVVGGGDWGQDRIIPDIVRAVKNNGVLNIRNFNATRPFQFILDCLHGYLLLAQFHIANKAESPDALNFGPLKSISIQNVLDSINIKLDHKIIVKLEKSNINEASNLELDSSLANNFLGWKNILSPQQSIDWTISWYLKYLGGKSARDLIVQDILDFKKLCK